MDSSSIVPPAFSFLTSDEDNQNSLQTLVIENDPKPFLSLQLNSEYRSTYQWHDFKPPLQTIGVAGKITGVDAGIVVIKRPPQPLFGNLLVYIRPQNQIKYFYKIST